MSQVLVCINLQQLKNYKSIEGCIIGINDDYKASVSDGDKEIVYGRKGIEKKNPEF